MEPILIAAILMVVIALAVISFMTCLGYDVRSRGFMTSGPAAMTLPKLGIKLTDYFRKRDQHPVTDESFVPKMRLFAIITV